MAKVLVGISGGLDSAFTVSLLLEAGHEVECAVLDMHAYTEVADAKKIADIFGVKFNIIDCRERFAANVIDYFVEEYSRGRTPNPCVQCNRTVKMAALCEYASDRGFDYAATGHYANKVYDEALGRYSVSRGADPKKDQSYMLWQLSQEQLAKLIFPLGNRLKSEIREKAAAMGLEVASRPESQEICFIPDDDHVSYIESRKGKLPRGNFVDLCGSVIGEHKGIIHYTIGQRKGLGMSFGEHMFVRSINADKNEITLCRAGEEYSQTLCVESLNFMGLAPVFDGEIPLDVKLRYAAPPVPAKVRFCGDKAYVELANPARAVTPGQSAVFYRDGVIMFGGIITNG